MVEVRFGGQSESTYAKGRNGYFQPFRAEVIRDFLPGVTRIEVYSKVVGGTAPIVLQLRNSDVAALVAVLYTIPELKNESPNCEIA